jgi:hypothetical protein
MSTTTIVPTEDAHAERWRRWQLANADGSCNAAKRARIVFAVILAVLAGWLGLQLLSSPLWA